MNAVAIFDPMSSFNSKKIVGSVKFHQCEEGRPTKVHISLSNLPPNTTRGFHFHTYGDLSQGCKTLCEHFNPTNKLHGSNLLYGNDRHAGDSINNITSDEKGVVNIIYMDDMIGLTGNNSVVGRSVVIHENQDNLGIYRYENSEKGKLSATTGDAGSRIACSVIGIAPENHNI